MPPSHVSRSSQRSRPRTASHTGRPCVEELARSARRPRRAPPATPASCARPSRSASAAPARSRSVERHIEPAAAPVDREDPARNSSAAAPCRPRPSSVEPRVVVAGDPQHEPADRIGRAAAVVEHVVPRRVARRDVTSCRNALSRSSNSETGRSCSRIVLPRAQKIEIVVRRSDSSASPGLTLQPCCPSRRAGGGDRHRRRSGLVGEVVGRGGQRRRSRRCADAWRAGSSRDATGKFS